MAEQKKVSLRSQQRATNAGKMPSPVEVDLPGLKGTLPFMPGKAIGDNPHLPEAVLAEEQRIRDEPIVTPEKEKRRAIKPPPVVNLEDLPDEKQKELLESVQEAMSRPEVQAFIPSGPGIGEAKALADRVAAQTEKKLKQRLASQPEKEEPHTSARSKQASTSTSEPEQAPVENNLPPSSEKKTTQEPTICIHCGWPSNSMELCKPTRLDKQTFVAAVLGQKRWSKEYDLLGGQLKVRFRSLTVEENDLVINQLIADWNAGKISGPAHSVAEATKYQMALSLESIETSIGPINLPPLEGYDYDEPKEGTILPEVLAYVQKTALPNENTRRIVSKAYGHFLDTQSKLEAMAETPDFWRATED